jgi:hypothetical protein
LAVVAQIKIIVRGEEGGRGGKRDEEAREETWDERKERK